MSDDINSIRVELWEKMRHKGRSFRETFVAAHLSTNIAAQIQTMREDRGWMQKDLAEKTGMSPARISIMENPSYEKFTISTLKRVASSFDVALIVRFAPFSELVNWVADLSPQKIRVQSFDEDSLDTAATSQTSNLVTVSNAVNQGTTNFLWGGNTAAAGLPLSNLQTGGRYLVLASPSSASLYEQHRILPSYFQVGVETSVEQGWRPTALPSMEKAASVRKAA